MQEYIVNRFEPLFLTVENIGPFQGRTYTVDFTTEDHQPCNFFLLVAQNGQGKSNLLQTMVDLMGMLDPGFQSSSESFQQEELRFRKGRARLDFLLEFQMGGKVQNCIFSLAAGQSDPFALKQWTLEEMKHYGVTYWVGYGADSGMELFKNATFNPDLAKSFIPFIQFVATTLPPISKTNPRTLPTLLYFPDNRGIPTLANVEERSISQPEGWGYRPVKCFHSDRSWGHSLDNVLVWLKWLDNGRLERTQQMINDWVFKGTSKRLQGVRKQPPEAVVSNGGVTHRLDRLSGGERNLAQLCLRLGVHMTRNTLVIIDEIDLHLHVKWQHRILNLLKNMVRTTPGLTVIATTHSQEIISSFAADLNEEGLRKGGQIIEPEKSEEE